MLKILVAEDDVSTNKLLCAILKINGYEAIPAFNGEAALDIIDHQHIDLLLCDVMMPKMDGFALTQAIRDGGSMMPILMLTAKEAIEDRVAGLDAGADDYLVKPFAFDELMARVRALLRRAQPNLPQVYRFADLELDTGTRQGRRGGVTFDLTAKAYELLELFMRHPRQVLTRDVIFDRVWNYDFGGESNIIEVYVRYLRQKTEQGGMQRLIHTVRGIGYVLREES